MMAQNRHKFRSIVYLVIAVANVVSTYLVAPFLGGIGAALCSCVSYLLGQGLIMNLYYYKKVEIDIPLFWRNITKMAVLPGVMMICSLVIQRFVLLDHWIPFFAGVAVYTVVYCGGMYITAMNDYEKDVIRKPIRKMIRIVTRK